MSSSGHLVLGGAVLGLEEGHLTFDIVLHAGTLVATLTYYRDSIWDMGRDGVRALRALLSGQDAAAVMGEYPGGRLLGLLAVGTVPTALMGLFFARFFRTLFGISFEQLAGGPRLAAGMLIVTAALLLGTRFVSGNRQRSVAGMRLWHALAIGFIQGLAIIPGISRSGATIACALGLGMKRELAARYSFLLAVPATLGAVGLKAIDGEIAALDGEVLAAGFVSAAVVGGLSLLALIPLVKSGRLHLFAFYLLPAALVALVLV